MLLLLVSVFGLIVSDRFLCRLEKMRFIFPRNKKHLMLILNIPTLALLFFKEHLIYFMLYIGLKLLILILIRIYFEKKLQNAFENSQIRFLDALIIQIRSGKSAIAALKDVFLSLNHEEKLIYEPIYIEFTSIGSVKVTNLNYTATFFEDLAQIISSNYKTNEQFLQLKSHLKIKQSLRHRSRAALMQIKAQALTAVGIFLLLFIFTWFEMQIYKYPVTIFVACLLLSTGIYVIFKFGETIKWKI